MNCYRQTSSLTVSWLTVTDNLHIHSLNGRLVVKSNQVFNYVSATLVGFRTQLFTSLVDSWDCDWITVSFICSRAFSCGVYFESSSLSRPTSPRHWLLLRPMRRQPAPVLKVTMTFHWVEVFQPPSLKTINKHGWNTSLSLSPSLSRCRLVPLPKQSAPPICPARLSKRTMGDFTFWLSLLLSHFAELRFGLSTDLNKKWSDFAEPFHWVQTTGLDRGFDSAIWLSKSETKSTV